MLPFSSRTVAYWLFASGHEARLQSPVKLNSFRQNFWVFVLQHRKASGISKPKRKATGGTYWATALV